MLKKAIKAITPYGILRLYQLYRSPRPAAEHVEEYVEQDVAPIQPIQSESAPLLEKYPVGISIEICNLCNLKCTTCGIWKDKTPNIFPMDKYIELLDSSMMKNLRYLDFTGGEPTMIDLPAYVRELIDRVPTLERVVININCFNAKRTINFISVINEMCVASGKILQLNISLNGIGKVHDETRGVDGSFDRVMEVVSAIRDMNVNNIEIILSGRIVKSNVFEMDEFIYFLKKNCLETVCIYPAVESSYFKSIDSEVTESTFNLDEDYQRELTEYKLQNIFPSMTFFMEYAREKRDTGVSIADCQFTNGDRLHLRSEGWFAYCCHCVNDVGMLEKRESFEKTYIGNLDSLQVIEEFLCPTCYYYPCIVPNHNYEIYQKKKAFWHRLFTIASYFEKKDNYSSEIEPTLKHRNNTHPTIFITGWYGTETAGDKAILGGIIDDYKEKHANAKFLISSLYPFVTKRTVYELGIEAEVIPVFSTDFFQAAASADETIIGGGPLMELEQLSVLCWAFYFAKKYGKKTKVYGCGVGPLFTDEKKDAVREIFSLADEICLRDEYSKSQAESISGKPCQNIGDPANKYIKKIGSTIKTEKDNKKLSLFLRSLSYHEYFKHMSHDEFLVLQERYEKGLAENIRYLYKTEGLIPHFYAMNNFVIGADDRDFNFYFVDKYLNDIETVVDKYLTTVERVAEQVMSASFNVCMRYHSVVFAHTLQTKFAPIDYTRGGKIPAYLQDHAPDTPPITLEQLADDPKCLHKALCV